MVIPSRRPALLLLAVALVVLALLPPVPPARAAPVSLPSVRLGTDTLGGSIQAHGGSMLRVGDTYYWVGEDKLDTPRVQAWAAGTWTVPFTRLRCWSSTDLRTWTPEGDVLTQQASGDLGPGRVVERPRVLFNEATRTFVMWVHVDSTTYAEAKVGVATSSTPCGAYTYRGSFRPLGRESRDLTVFRDTDGAAYLVHSSDGNTSRRVVRLSDDYTSVTEQVAQLGPGEAPAVVKDGDTYVMLASHATGWKANDNFYATAPAMSGPWTERGDFTPGSTTTFDAQTTAVVPVTGTAGTTYLWMGDRWQVDAGTTSGGLSPYVWLPLTIDGTTVTMAHHGSWSLDAAAGTWAPGAASCSPVAGATYRLDGVGSGKALDVAGGTTTSGALAQQQTYTGRRSQQWTVVGRGSGYVALRNAGSSKLLDVWRYSTADGADVVQWPWTGGTNQQWSFADAGGGRCVVVSRSSGKVLDVQGRSRLDGARVQQWTRSGATNQQWLLSVV